MDSIVPTPPLSRMRETTLAQQLPRQHIAENWQPLGFARYVKSKAELDAMSVFGGGPGENGGASPDRFRPLSGPLEEDLPTHP